MKSKLKELYQNTIVTILWCLCYLFGLLPRCVRYGVIAPLVEFVLRRCMHYRYSVIKNQLQDSYPDKSEAEIEELCRRYYRHLAEMVVGTLSLAAMNDKRRAKDIKFDLPQNFHEQIEGRNMIVLTSHYGFWELALNLYLSTPNHHLVAAYRPLTNPTMDKLMRRLRSSESADVVPSKQLIRHFVSNRNGIKGKNIVVGLISDQNCPPTKGCCWHNFLRHDSLFFDGGEQLAMKFHLPIFYVELERIEAGRYCIKYTQVYDGNEEVKPHEITERYVRSLEQTIDAQPEYWMWSHRRWKHRPTSGAKFYDNYKTIE